MPNIMSIMGGGAAGPHHATHELLGSDPVNVTGLTGAMTFVDAGDKAAGDYGTADFTKNGAEHDIDMNAKIPAGAKLVTFRIGVNTAAAQNIFAIRQKSKVNAWNVAAIRTQAANIYMEGQFTIPCDANRVFTYWADNIAYASLDVTIMSTMS